LTKEISDLKRQGYEIVLVSSGAIAQEWKIGYKTRPQPSTTETSDGSRGPDPADEHL